jgi:UDPglucose--hexose-1-phosphate uridylyltransferase
VFVKLDKEKGIEYVYEFEERGKGIQANQRHPHAQVYALPFIPPRIKQEITQFRKMWENDKMCLVCQILENELKALTSRIILETDDFVSFVPHFARLPYEVHIYPKEHVGSLTEIEDKLLSLGIMVQDVVRRYSSIFDEMMYVIAFHTRPSTGEHPYWHFHIEIYPSMRNHLHDKPFLGLKSGLAVSINNSCPEDIAKELREAN